MPVVTKQELEDAAVDAQTMEDVANGSETINGTGLVTSRLGQSIKTLAKVIADLEASGIAVTSVNGENGVVVLDTSDIAEAGDNLYITAAELAKLAGIESNATADQTDAEILTAWESESGRDASVDGTKLDTIETNAKDDQTGSEIEALLDAELGSTDWKTGGNSTIEARTSDYIANAGNLGKIWMRTDLGTATVKAVIESAGTAGFSNGGTVTTPRVEGSGSGDINEALVAGGWNGALVATTEEYNGTAFSAGGSVNTSFRYGNGAGTALDNAISTAGRDGTAGARLDRNEVYSSSVWSNAASALETIFNHAMSGLESNAVYCGGNNGSLTSLARSFNGSAWSAEANMATNIQAVNCCGLRTSVIRWGGSTVATEEYDGASWSAGGNTLSTFQYGTGNVGDNTDARICGASTSIVQSEVYNGTSFSASDNMVTATSGSRGGGAGSATMISISGNSSGGYIAPAQEYAATSSVYEIKEFSFV